MNYERLENGQVLSIEVVETPNQKAMVKTPIGMETKIAIDTDKNQLNISEDLLITLKWKKFSIEQGQYQDDPTNTQPILLNILGETEELPTENGQATILFNSETPGEFEIQTVNSGVDNAYIKVVVQDA